MIKSIPKIFLIFSLITFSGLELIGQLDDPLAPKKETKKIYVGPIAGYNRVMHSTNKPAIPLALDDVPCPNFENGSANGFFAGASVEFMLGSAANSRTSIIGRLMYSTMPSYFEQQGDNLPTTVNVQQQDGSLKPEQRITSINYLNDIDYSTIALDVLFKFNFIDIVPGKIQLGVVGGPTFDYALTTGEINRMQLVSPENASLVESPQAAENGWSYPDPRTLQFNDGEIPDAQAFRMGLKVGAQLEITASGMIIVPNVMYNMGLTNLSPEFDWRVSALQIGVDLRFAI